MNNKPETTEKEKIKVETEDGNYNLALMQVEINFFVTVAIFFAGNVTYIAYFLTFSEFNLLKDDDSCDEIEYLCNSSLQSAVIIGKLEEFKSMVQELEKERHSVGNNIKIIKPTRTLTCAVLTQFYSLVQDYITVLEKISDKYNCSRRNDHDYGDIKDDRLKALNILPTALTNCLMGFIQILGFVKKLPSNANNIENNNNNNNNNVDVISNKQIEVLLSNLRDDLIPNWVVEVEYLHIIIGLNYCLDPLIYGEENAHRLLKSLSANESTFIEIVDLIVGKKTDPGKSKMSDLSALYDKTSAEHIIKHEKNKVKLLTDINACYGLVTQKYSKIIEQQFIK
ncbi:uncharacterized protein SCDLUD_004448 [Saccharomycodes ludwigii]|uniref:uncharacterized protein n=1 Tax=Saccharomycodes ludwigii TaxID=36035 RepID=UPI001E850CB8|nr:hypothetical protein SCDLUD_004448 [Saccharomycodes ludwigii]KAH3899027.1 hypothetical protein SCDLUD_004448 [Saccharomycodes ludwigii]